MASAFESPSRMPAASSLSSDVVVISCTPSAFYCPWCWRATKQLQEEERRFIDTLCEFFSLCHGTDDLFWASGRPGVGEEARISIKPGRGNQNDTAFKK